VDDDRIKGAMKEGSGKVKEAWGDATDDPETEIEGYREQVEGEIQQRKGEIEDDIKEGGA